MAAGVLFAAAELVAVSPAFGNAPNPNADIAGTSVTNADGTVTVNLSGTWTWPGQACSGRYGEGWAVDWWGISSSKTPSNPFSLTNATEVQWNSPGNTSLTTGTISPAGSWQIKGSGPPPLYLHVSQPMNGEVVNANGGCTDSGSGPNVTSSGNWSAAATYPNSADVPQNICVNMYDLHNGGQNDLDATKNGDNSVNTNSFNPTSGSGYCVHITPGPPLPIGAIGGVGLAVIVGGAGGFVMWRRRRTTAAIGSAKGA